MNPRLKRGGLHLGASRCNRLHDGSPGDIHSGIDVSVHRMAAVLTDKGGLALAIGFFAVSTSRASTGRVTRINRMQWHTGKSSLVGKKRTELPK